MSAVLRTLCLLLCVQLSVGRICNKWNIKGGDACCELCEPGYRHLGICGPDPQDLCTPCESGTFTVNPKAERCDRCMQCVGAQVELEACTPSSDTRCGCIEGLTCGDQSCSFCVDRCGKGKEPDESRSCRPCPPGTFNDQIHQKCKPWSTRCPNSEHVLSKGDAFSDIKCNSTSLIRPQKPAESDEDTGQSEVVVFAVVFSITIVVFIIIVVKVTRRKKKVTLIRTIINPPDGPQALTATECSFHEAEQEQGSSDSTEQLIL